MPETVIGYRYPSSTDVPNVPLDLQRLADDATEKEIITLMGAWA